ncbi:hypothetical protein BSKO_06205 [Bryopsis sp. KO-2023]|nr:hypothetical protein BSKO_06205 [Bryopsis sp. KO-2023]
MPPGILPHNSRKVHIQSIAKSRPRERLAEDLISLKEQLRQAQDREQKLQVGKRRVEGELHAVRCNLNKAEEILRQRSRGSSPNKMLSSFGQSPEHSSLVRSLKEQNIKLREARDQLELELARMKRSTRLTKMSELESEVSICHEEIHRQKAISEFLFNRLDEAEQATQAAASMAADVARNIDDAAAGLSSSPVMSNKSLPRTMEIVQNAHRILIQHANSLKARLPMGVSFQELEGDESALSKPSKAPVQVLKFLRTHMSRMESALLGLPGGQLTPSRPPSATATPRNSRSRPSSAHKKPIKNTKDIADTIRIHVKDTISSLEDYHCDGAVANRQIQNLIGALDGLRQEFANAVERSSGVDSRVENLGNIDVSFNRPSHLPDAKQGMRSVETQSSGPPHLGVVHIPSEPFSIERDRPCGLAALEPIDGPGSGNKKQHSTAKTTGGEHVPEERDSQELVTAQSIDHPPLPPKRSISVAESCEAGQEVEFYADEVCSAYSEFLEETDRGLPDTTIKSAPNQDDPSATNEPEKPESCEDEYEDDLEEYDSEVQQIDVSAVSMDSGVSELIQGERKNRSIAVVDVIANREAIEAQESEEEIACAEPSTSDTQTEGRRMRASWSSVTSSQVIDEIVDELQRELSEAEAECMSGSDSH